MTEYDEARTRADQRKANLAKYYPANFVPAERQEIVRPAGPVQHQVDLRVPQQALQVVEVRTSATDRAKGFSIETGQLSAIFAIATVSALWYFADLPVLSLAAFVTFVGVYALVWAGAWPWHRLVSAEGVSLISAILMWVYLFIDQREQHKRQRGE